LNWDMGAILWQTVYLFLAVGAVFAVWAMSLYKKKKDWKQIFQVAAFCFIGAALMVTMPFIVRHFSFTARLGLISLILIIYAYYSYRHRNNNN
jgi:hypothetical protein